MKKPELKRKPKPRSKVRSKILKARAESVPKPRRKKSERTKAIELCDTLWSEAVRTRDHYRCQVCGKETKMTQGHHIFSRQHYATRWDVDNGITLCWACHMFKAHGDARGDLYWFIEHEWMTPAKYAELHERSLQLVHVTPAFLAETEERLRKEIRHWQDLAEAA